MADNKSGRSVGRPRKDESQVKDMRRYNLALPKKQFEAVQEIAHEDGTSFLNVLQGMVRIGIYLRNAVKNEDAQVIVRKPGKDGGSDEDTQILIP